MGHNLNGKVAVITGGGGIICGEIALALAKEGVKTVIWDILLQRAANRSEQILNFGGTAMAIECDVTSKSSVTAAADAVLDRFGTIDILINGAGGNRKECTTSPTLKFFDIAPEMIQDTVSLNYLGTVIPSQEVGRVFADKKSGVILNISSISSICALTRIPAYSGAKAAINNFTQWLAVHMAQNYSPNIRVNAIAPGFLLTEQNRYLLTDEKTGEMTERGRQIIAHTPLARYGDPKELIGAVLWLVSGDSSFVTGAIIPIDGGFSAFAGV